MFINLIEIQFILNTSIFMVRYAYQKIKNIYTCILYKKQLSVLYNYIREVDGVEDTSQTGHTYVIDEVEEDSGGEYRCTGVNVIEVGQQVTPVSLVVQCMYTIYSILK